MRAIHSDTDLEAAVLGQLLFFPDRVYKCAEALGPQHFFDSANGAIYAAIQEVFIKQKEIDIVIVQDELIKSGNGHLTDYAAQLADTNSACQSDSLGPLSQRLIESYSKRTFDQVLKEARDINEDATQDFEEVLSKTMSDISKLMPDKPHIATADKSADRFLEEMEEKSHFEGQQVVGVPTGITHMDSYTKGFRKSSMITVAANTGYGKTYFALNMMMNLAQMGYKCLYFSLEMSDVELMYRTLPMLKKPGQMIKPHELYLAKMPSPDREAELHSLIEEYRSLPITIDWGTNNFNKIILTCEKERRLRGLDFVVIDHLQLLEESSDHAVLSRYTRGFKNYALQHEIPIVTISQLNRNAVARQNKEPSDTDLKGSGSIGQDSDVILFLHRDNPDDNTTKLILHKYRQATSATRYKIGLEFNPDNNRFIERLGPSNYSSSRTDNQRENPYHDLQTATQKTTSATRRGSNDF